MHPLRSDCPRFLSATCGLLILLGGFFWLSPRGAAQESTGNVLPPSQNVPANGAASDTSAGGGGLGDASDSGNANGTDTNGSDNALNRSGGSAANPSVGVDTVGRTDATATRNGRTTRRRPVALANPLVITNSIRTNGNIALDMGERLSLPAPAREPGVYTLPTDPSSYGSDYNAKPLPLFGYDFFQPARQIILARRRALLPAPPRTVPRTGRFGTTAGTRSRTRPQLGQDVTPNSAGDLSAADNYPTNNYPANGDAVNSDTSNADLAGAALAARRARSADGNGPDALGGSGMDSSQSNADSAAPDNANADANSMNADGTSNSAANGNGSDNGGMDTGSSSPARQQRSASPDAFSSGSEALPGSEAFPGDAQRPGSDIQFPGDDALVQNSGGASGLSGGTSAVVTGEIADPIATLYRNTLGSLPTNYQLQPGDSLTVRYSALALAPREFSAVVDSEGGLGIEGIGRVFVVGRTAAQAEDALRRRLERLYRNVDVSISLRQIRTIQVTISGAAFAPGTYTVPATASAFNVLNAAGGPTANGSLRDIRLLRNGRLAGILDIYPLIGATSASPSARHGDLSLQAGDTIYIPARLSRITIRGEVRQEAVYELTQTETLRDALSYSGGIKPSGVGQTIHIDTVDRGVGRELRDINVTSRAAVPRIPLYDGDSVEIASVRSILTNRVTISGAVNQPGDYALVPGMRVVDLLQRAKGVLYDTYVERAELTRLNSDNTTTVQPLNIGKALDGSDPTQNVALVRFDRLQLYTRQDVSYLGRRQVTVRGAVQRPGLYTQSDNMHVSDLLLETGGPLTDAYLNRAVLLHQRGDGTFAYEYVNLHDVISGEDPSQDLPILDNDILAVYRVGEAHFTPDHTVKVLGDVVAPGLYARGDAMKLSDLLKLAGAFKPGGGTRVTVAHARRPSQDTPALISPITVAFSPEGQSAMGTDLSLQDGDVVAVQGNGSIKDHPAVITVTGAVNRPGPIIISGNTRLSDAVREAGGLRPEAFPQGAEFTRTPDALITTGQLNLANVISHMSDMLNLSQYQRERAKASLALIDAAGSAASGGSSTLPIPGLGGSSSNASNPNIAPLIGTLSQINPVSQGRILTPSQLQPNGGVAVRLAEALHRPGGTEDILLKDGDTLVVPETPTTVQVIGAVVNARGVLFKPGQSIDYYIQRAGDFTPDAAKDRIEVIHAGGGLIPASKAGAIQPGDLILVPTKVLAENLSRSGNSFSAFFQGLVGSAITLKVLTSVFGL